MDKETKQMFELILSKLDNMEKRQESMETKLHSMEKTQESMETKLHSMEKRQESMEVKLHSMETRQGEIFEVVKAIEHSNNAKTAEIDNLKYKVAHVEGTINGIGNFIEERRVIK